MYCMTPARTSDELDVQNEREENTQNTVFSFSLKKLLLLLVISLGYSISITRVFVPTANVPT